MMMRTISRRQGLIGAVGLVCALATPAMAAKKSSQRGAPQVSPIIERVEFTGFPVGTVVIRTKERKLYLVIERGVALRYNVAVGQVGKQWRGVTVVNGRYKRPAWSPPEDVRRDNPSLPDVIPGGAPNNPMGEAAMTLAGGEYAIHGTNRPDSIGKAASYGCFRMFNEDVLDLIERVGIGTEVVVM